MRDTLVFAGMIAAIVGLVLWNQSERGSSMNGYTAASSSLSTKGAMNEGNIPSQPRTAQRDQRTGRGEGSEVELEGAGGTSAESSAESQALNSIYASKKLNDSKKKLKRKVVHGVPLEDFVQGRRNSLPAEVSSAAPNGVRVFLQCMEVREGKTENLTESQCKELAQRSTLQRNSIMAR